MNSVNPWEFPPPVFFSIYSSYKTSCYVNYSLTFSSFYCSVELLLVKFMWVTHSSRRSIIYTRQDSYNEALLREFIQALYCSERGSLLFQAGASTNERLGPPIKAAITGWPHSHCHTAHSAVNSRQSFWNCTTWKQISRNDKAQWTHKTPHECIHGLVAKGTKAHRRGMPSDVEFGNQ